MTRILTTIIMLIVSLAMQAQKGLPINKLFAGDIVPQNEMVETRIKGKEIAKYQLSYFRSLRFEATHAEIRRITELLGKDCGKNYQRVVNKKTLTIMLQLEPRDGHNRFLCFKSGRADKGTQVTVIYMEGTLRSLDKMNEILK